MNMSKDIITIEDCLKDFNDILDRVTKMRSIIKCLATKPVEFANKLSILEQELSTVEQTIYNLRWCFGGNLWDKCLKGQRMTREEFYLLAAQGIMKIPSETGMGDAYDEYNYYFYEDNEQRGYINPSARPDPPPVPKLDGGWTQTISQEIGIVPEDVKISFLNEEQKDFFKKYKPELFLRFKKD